jgi:mono/diheme cytochrome c family protein
MKKLVGTIIVLVLLTVGGFAFIYLGVFDIAADHPHNNLTLWIINKTVTQSVKRRSREINRPDLSKMSMIRTGGYHFQQMCIQCHSGPGVQRSEAGEGLYPQGPDLTWAKAHWEPRDLFWITKHGLKMTGMPAWGQTTTDEEIWAMVAFIEQLPAISPERYQQMLNEAETTASGDHGPGEH